MFRFSLFILILFIWGCRNSKPEEKGTFKIDWNKSEKWKNEYAQGFSIEQSGKYYRISIKDPQSGKEYGKYVLYPHEGEKPLISEGETGIAYPIKSFVSVSTTHLPFLKLLNEENSLTGFAGQKLVLSEHFKELFKEKNIPELGSDNALNIEKIIEIFPEVMMVYPFGNLSFTKIEKAKIPVFYNTEYLELHPLGKTEWIKVFGLLYGKENKSEQIFTKISYDYNSAKKRLVNATTSGATAFTGLNFSGTWHVPGGKSFQAQFLKDAFINYIWKDDSSNNSLSLPAETVIDKCIDADYWIIVSTEKENFSLQDLINMDPNYKYFKAVKNGNVIFCNSGVKDYFGESIIEPNVLLDDLIYYLHPSLRDFNYQPKYFQILE